ncbi:MAG: TIGR04255 family protein [Candidatus Magasanikbacteria bacterium]
MTSKQYKTPPLVEAVCEFRFDPKSIWDSTIPGLLYEQIKGDFPIRENVTEGVVEFFFNKQKDLNPRIDHTENEVPRFWNEKKNLFVVLKKNLLSVHCVNSYTGWDEFKKHIIFIFGKYILLANPVVGLNRVGLRYINEIPFEKIDSSGLQKNFLFRPNLVQGVVEENNFLGLQVGYMSKEDDNLVKIQLNNIEKLDKGPVFVFDVDYFNNKVVDFDNIVNWMDQAHSRIEYIFENSITQELKQTFDK